MHVGSTVNSLLFPSPAKAVLVVHVVLSAAGCGQRQGVIWCYHHVCAHSSDIHVAAVITPVEPERSTEKIEANNLTVWRNEAQTHVSVFATARCTQL